MKKHLSKYLVIALLLISFSPVIFVAVTFLQNNGLAALEFSEWKISFQEPASAIMGQIIEFHNVLLIVSTLIVLLVCGLLTYACYKFSAKRNPNPSKTSHNTLIEIIWTAVPALVLIMLAFPSLKLLYKQYETPKSELTLKIVGRQWYWSYEYPEQKIAFDSYMKEEQDIDPEKGEKYLLSTDTKLVLPINTTIKVLITAGDVIHAWAVPALGVKKDAVPGKTSEISLNITKPGIYHGQCSELCGAMHGFMPIEIIAVSKEEFKKWSKNYKPQS